MEESDKPRPQPVDGLLEYISISRIDVPPDRQRKDLGDLESLRLSIVNVGVLNPIIVRQVGDRYELIAGERRLRACQLQGMRGIPARLFEKLSPLQREAVELEENIKRKSLEWTEEAWAVYRYFKKRQAEGGTWDDVRAALSVGNNYLGRVRSFCEEVENTPALASATTLTAAANAVRRIRERRNADIIEDLIAPESSAPPTDSFGSFSAVDFHSFASTYSGRRFNLLHCDFPYGIDMDKANLQGGAANWDSDSARYSDSKDLYFSLLDALLQHHPKFLADSAHIIFWFSMNYYAETVSAFRAKGFVVNPFPLIWHKSDGAGIVPDPARGPRRTYETALLITQGDRKIIRTKANSFASPTTKVHHLSEKPLPVVTHFLEMLCDDTTYILDPTCGSGTALEAATHLGATEVCGLDIDERHVAIARKRCADAHARRGAQASFALDLGIA